MARMQRVDVVCDRCARVYEPTEADAPKAAAGQPHGLFVDATDLDLGQIVFEDLCAKCKKRIGDLVDQMKRGKGEETKAPTSTDAEESTHRPDDRDDVTPETEERS